MDKAQELFGKLANATTQPDKAETVFAKVAGYPGQPFVGATNNEDVGLSKTKTELRMAENYRTDMPQLSDNVVQFMRNYNPDNKSHENYRNNGSKKGKTVSAK